MNFVVAAVVTASYGMGMPLPAPIPPVNAWEKPINLSGGTPPAPPASAAATADVAKYDKAAEQHDSGIDLAEQQNSNMSSTRSSPNSGRLKVRSVHSIFG